MQVVRPAVEWELASLLREAAERAMPLEIIGGGSKRAFGRSVQAAKAVVTSALRAISLYEPSELVMSALAGTLLADVERELSGKGQMLPFEPIDLGPVLGAETGLGTIGGVFATNLSGSRRVLAGAARDHLLGVRAINGRGEAFKSGGRVMKNVTGYDLARGLAGSWGTLAVMTEVTFKVQPKPETTATLVLIGLADEIASEVMCLAMGSPYEVSGAVHLHEPVVGRLWNATLRGAGGSVTAIRLENFAKFIAYRKERLGKLLGPYGEVHAVDEATSLAFWSELRQLSALQRQSTPLWRLSVTPTSGPKIVKAIAQHMQVEAVYDWSGGLIWLGVPSAADAGASDIRRVIAHHGGHATLVRAAPAVRAAIEVFQPLEPGIDRISRGLKAAFDPAGILNPGRMHASF